MVGVVAKGARSTNVVHDANQLIGLDGDKLVVFPFHDEGPGRFTQA